MKARYLDGQRKVSTASWLGNQTRDTYKGRGNILGLNLVRYVTRGPAFLCRRTIHSFMRLPALQSPIRSNCDI